MQPFIELPSNIKDLPDLPQERRSEIINEAVRSAGHVMLMAYFLCKVPNYISGGFQDEAGNEYDLKFGRKGFDIPSAPKLSPEQMAAGLALPAPAATSVSGGAGEELAKLLKHKKAGTKWVVEGQAIIEHEPGAFMPYTVIPAPAGDTDYAVNEDDLVLIAALHNAALTASPASVTSPQEPGFDTVDLKEFADAVEYWASGLESPEVDELDAAHLLANLGTCGMSVLPTAYVLGLQQQIMAATTSLGVAETGGGAAASEGNGKKGGEVGRG